jgi:hypothetical protein
MEGPNGRWKTEDGELTTDSTARTRRVVARVWICLLGRGSVCSGRRIGCGGRTFVAPAGECLLGGPPARSGHGPAPSPLVSFAPRVARRIRQSAWLLGRPSALVGVEDAYVRILPPASGTGMSAPAPPCPLGARSVGAAARFVVSGAESSCAASDLSSPASDSSAPAPDASPSAAAEKTE